MVTDFTATQIQNQQVTSLDTALVLDYLFDYLLFAPPKFSGAEDLLVYQETLKGKPSIHDAWDAISGAQKGTTINIASTGRFTAYQKTPQIEMVDQAFDIGKVSLTINAHYYVSALVEDATSPFDNIGLKERIAKAAGRALAESAEDLVIALFNTFSTTDPSTQNTTTLTYGEVGKIAQSFYQKGLDVMKNDTYLAMSPFYYAALAQTRNTYTAAGGDKSVQQYANFHIIEDPSGIKILPSNRLNVVSSNVKMFAWQDQALMWGWPIPPKFEYSRDPKALGWRSSMNYLAGFGKLRDLSGMVVSRQNQ